jgi:hypothetical protein
MIGAVPAAVDQLNADALGGARGCVADRFHSVVNGMDIVPRLLGHWLGPSEREVFRWMGAEGSRWMKGYKDEVGWVQNALPRLHEYRPVGKYFYLRERGDGNPARLADVDSGESGGGAAADAADQLGSAVPLTPSTEVVAIKPDWTMPFLRMHLDKDADLFKALGVLTPSLAGFVSQRVVSKESIALATKILMGSRGITDHTSYAENMQAARGRSWAAPGWKAVPFVGRSASESVRELKAKIRALEAGVGSAAYLALG